MGKTCKRFSEQQLEWLRSRSLEWSVEKMGGCISVDSSFSPIKDTRTQVWFITLNSEMHEILVTGIKWMDKRENKSGGGCIDLTMHLLKCDFVTAVKKLLGAN